MQPFQNLSSWWMGRAPQHPLSRPSLLRVVKICFRFDVMQTFKRVQLNGWSCSLNTVQLKSRWWNNFSSEWREAFQKRSKVRLGRAPPNTAQFFPRCWKTFLSGCYAAISKSFKLMAGRRSPTSPVTAQLISWRWTSFLFWCYADFQQRSIERLVVLPQTRSSSNHADESTFCPEGVKPFKNVQILSWVVLPQTRPSSFHGVEKLFCLDVMQPFQILLSWWLGRAPQHSLSRPSSFGGVEDLFFFDVVQHINSVQMNGRSCSPKHGPTLITVLSQLFVRMAWSFSKTFKL